MGWTSLDFIPFRILCINSLAALDSLGINSEVQKLFSKVLREDDGGRSRVRHKASTLKPGVKEIENFRYYDVLKFRLDQ